MSIETTTTEAFEALMPEPAEYACIGGVAQSVYTDDQVRTAMKAAWNAATERAAKLCEEQAGCASFVNNIGATFAAEQCAAAIRASSRKGGCDV